jgi:4-nitrophenyl phosphatase
MTIAADRLLAPLDRHAEHRHAEDGIGRLASAAGFVFDLDGTLVLPDKRAGTYQALPGAVEVLARMRSTGMPLVALTNNTLNTPADCAALLRAAGINLNRGEIITPSSVAAEYFKRRRFRRVLAIGGEGVWRPLAENGIDVVLTDAPASEVDAVYAGYHPDFGMQDIEAGCRACWGGAKLFVSSGVPYFATQGGRAIGISRVIGAAITNMTGRRFAVLGKPSAHALRCAGQRLGRPVDRLAVIGDDPQLETVMARQGGALAVAVETGLGRLADFTALPPHHRPHLVLRHIGELLAWL